jgi:hypothetical protein
MTVHWSCPLNLVKSCAGVLDIGFLLLAPRRVGRSGCLDLQDSASEPADEDIADGGSGSEAAPDTPPAKRQRGTKVKVEIDEHGHASLSAWGPTLQPPVLDKKTALKSQCVMCIASGKD